MSEGNQDLILIRSIKSMYFIKIHVTLRIILYFQIFLLPILDIFFILDVIPDMILINLYKPP